MKKSILIISIITFVVIFGVSFSFSSPVLHMGIDGFPPGTNYIVIQPSTLFKIDFWLSDVPSPGLIGWAQDLILDPLVELKEVNFENPFSGKWEIVSNELEMYALIPPSGVNPVYGDKVPLVNITFHCLGVGITELIPAWHFPIAENYVLGDFSVLDYALGFPEINLINPSKIVLNQVPIPGTLLLIGSGFLGLIGLKRKFRF